MKILYLCGQILIMEKKSKALEITKKIVKFILFFGVGILFVYLSIKDLNAEQWNDLKSSAAVAMQNGGWVFLCLAFVIGLTDNVIRALRNKQLLTPLGYNVRSSSVFNSVMVCYLANLAFPRLGEVLRCTYLQYYDRVPFEKTLGTVITERAVDFICFLIVLISAILLNTRVLSELIVDDQGTSLGESLSSTFNNWIHNYKFFIIVGVIIMLCVVAYLTRNRWGKIGFFAKIKKFFEGIWQGLISIKDLEKPWLFIVYTLLIWILYFAEVLACVQAFPFLNGLPLMAIFTVFAMGNIGFLIGPGGLGAYPLLVAATLVLYNINYTQGLATGWVGWGVQTLMVVSVGTCCMIAASLTKRKMNVQEQDK